MTRALPSLLLLLAWASPSRAVEAVEIAAEEPSVRQLQRAAERLAAVDPDRVRSWQRRLRVAALAPQLHLLVGRGARLLEVTKSAAGVDQLAVDNSSTWTFGARATWALDRLVFDRTELRLSHEAQRLAARRETLLTDVARLYFQRRRLQAALALRPPADELDRVEAQLRIDELGAILDGLTDGALSRGSPP